MPITAKSIKKQALDNAKMAVTFAKQDLAKTKDNVRDMSMITQVLAILAVLGLNVRNAWLSKRGEKQDLELGVKMLPEQGFKAPNIMATIACFSELIGEPESREIATSWDAEKVFTFRSEDFILRLNFEVASDSQTCRRVKVGEKFNTVKEDVYKLECS